MVPFIIAMVVICVVFGVLSAGSSNSSAARHARFQEKMREFKEQLEKLRADQEVRAKAVEAHYADHPAVENVHIGQDGNGKPCILVELRDNESPEPKLIPLAHEVAGMKVYVEVIPASTPTPLDTAPRSDQTDASPIAHATDETPKPEANADAPKPSDDSSKS